MAELLTKIPTSVTEYPKSFKRQGCFPLEAYSVFYATADKTAFEAAQDYASKNAIAYVGQTLAVVTTKAEDSTVVDNVTFYIIADAAGTLQEVGKATNGDGKSIVLNDGILSLAGFEAAQAATLPQKQTDGTIKWVPIDSIVEGDTNTKTVVAVGDEEAHVNIELVRDDETDTNTYKISLDLSAYATTEFVEAAIDTAKDDLTELINGAKTELESEITAEETTRKAADEALTQAIADALAEAKQYADDNDANTVYNDTEVRGLISGVSDRVTALEGVVGNAESGLIKDLADEIARAQGVEEELQSAIEAIDFVDPDELKAAIEDFATKQYVDESIEAVEEAVSKLNHFKTEIVDSIDKVTELGVLYLIKDESVAGVDKYNEYIVVDGAAVLIGDTTTDLSNYYNKDEIDSKVEAIEGAIADEEEAREALAERVGALEEIETVTQGEFGEYKEEVTQAIADAKQAAIDDADGKLADKLDTSVFTEFQGTNATAIATAKQEAIDAAADAEEAKGYAVATDVAATYATKEEFNAHVNAAESVFAKATEVAATYATKSELTAHETAAEAAYAKKSDVYTTTEIDNLIKNINQGNQATAGEVSAALESYKTSNDKEIANLKEKDVALTTAVEAAQAKADQGVADAANAKAAADAAAGAAAAAQTAISVLADGQVSTNKNNIATLTEIVSGKSSDDENSHAYRIGQLEAREQTHSTEYSTLTGKVNANSAELVKKANAADVYDKTSVDNLLTDKADKADTYTKDEVDELVQEAIDQIPEVDFEPYATNDYVNAEFAKKANAADVYAKSDVYTKTEADAEFMTQTEVDDRINALILAADPEGGKVISNIQKLVEYVDTNAGEIATLISDVATNKAAHEKNATDIATINDTIAAMLQPKESAEISVADDGTLGIKEVNVNKLIQTAGDTLVLNGGSASVQA